MQGTISPDVAAVAVALHRSHPHAPVLDMLDAALRQRAGRVDDPGPDVHAPCSPFGQSLAEAFNRGMAPGDWGLVTSPNTPAHAVAALMQLWHDVVLAPFACGTA